MTAASSALPAWVTSPSPFVQDHPTISSDLQEETVDECLPYLLDPDSDFDLNPYGLPHLTRDKHVKFLKAALSRLPSGFTTLDASRTWFPYWGLVALSLLGQELSQYRPSLINTLRPLKNKNGGFAGGYCQYPHLATTYGALLAIATVGGEEAYDLIDRRALWNWLGTLKRPQGDFIVSHDGEYDLRGTYIALVILSLLNLPLDLPQSSSAREYGLKTFLDGVPEWISKCQTAEGGLSDNPGNEAHGAYTFCGLACLCILGPPKEMLAKYLDLPQLIRWLSARQYAPEGGLAGRTNKLVDGCYSHWQGGCWSLVEDAARTLLRASGPSAPSVHTLWNREGLIRYILCCAQGERGGLRDKPSKMPDAYHTLYNLAGLSWTQYRYSYNDSAPGEDSRQLLSGFKWQSTPVQGHNEHEVQIFEETDRVGKLDPVYVTPMGSAKRMRDYFDLKGGI